MRRKNKRGQAAVTDLFVAVAIFITLITITSTLWSIYNVRLNSRVFYDDMVVKAFQVSDIILKTPGDPSNWEYYDFNADPDLESNISYIGLVDTEKHISYNKTLALTRLGIAVPNATKRMFHIGQYNFGIRILNVSGAALYEHGIVGANSKFAVNLARTMFYEKDETSQTEIVTVEISLSK